MSNYKASNIFFSSSFVLFLLYDDLLHVVWLSLSGLNHMKWLDVLSLIGYKDWRNWWKMVPCGDELCTIIWGDNDVQARKLEMQVTRLLVLTVTIYIVKYSHDRENLLRKWCSAAFINDWYHWHEKSQINVETTVFPSQGTDYTLIVYTFLWQYLI